MGALSIYPDLPGIGTEFSEADLRQRVVIGDEFDFSRWPLKTQDINVWDMVSQSGFHTLGKPLCQSIQDQASTFDVPEWNTEYSKSQVQLRSLPSQAEGLNPVPYNYTIPRGASPEGYWCGERPAMEQDSCSVSNTWSPRPSEGHVESDAGYSSRASRNEFVETPLTEISRWSPHFPSGYGPFHSPGSPSYIAPLETQIYPDLEAEQVKSKHQLQEMKTGQQPYYKEAMNIVPSQIELLPTYFHEDSSSPLADDEDEMQMEVEFEDDKADEDYNGRSPKRLHRRNNSNFRNLASSPLNKRAARAPKSPTLTKPSKVAKNVSSATKPLAPSPSPTSPTSPSKGGKANCPQCPASFPSPSALHKHTLALHTRPFTCSFKRYGCPANFGSKNEWKRHVSSQHLRLGIYRCDINTCIPNQPRRKSSSSSYDKSLQKAESDPSSPSSDRPSEPTTGHNEFNRKDLFTQHVRRMHGPRQPGSQRRNGASAEMNEFDEKLDAIRQRCWVQLRSKPPRSFCGFCRFKQEQYQKQHDQNINSLEVQSGLDRVNDVIFDGDSAWDDRMEHVGKHLERGETEEAEDDVLRQWMADQGLLLKKNGQWEVVGCGSRRGTLKASNAGSGSSGGDKGYNEEDADGVMVLDQ